MVNGEIGSDAPPSVSVSVMDPNAYAPYDREREGWPYRTGVRGVAAAAMKGLLESKAGCRTGVWVAAPAGGVPISAGLFLLDRLLDADGPSWLLRETRLGPRLVPVCISVAISDVDDEADAGVEL